MSYDQFAKLMANNELEKALWYLAGEVYARSAQEPYVASRKR